MIFVDGVRFSTHSSSAQENDILVALMENPFLVSAASSFRAQPEKKFTLFGDAGAEAPMNPKYVYLFQREYATVDPALVDLVGMDEATTCVGLVIRNRESGMTSAAHMDSPNVVDMGLGQMLSHVVDDNFDVNLDVHLVGGFDDASHKHENSQTNGGSSKVGGYSFPLCAKIIEALEKSGGRFHIQNLFVLGHNTKRDVEGHAYPIFNGFLVETLTGCVVPASFDNSSRVPDEIVRRIRVSASFEDPKWKGKLLETYDTRADQFKIASCFWSSSQIYIALMLQELSDSEILLDCSTSPSAEAPDFVDNERRKWDYLIKHPNWLETFPMKQPRIFKRTAGGGWTRC